MLLTTKSLLVMRGLCFFPSVLQKTIMEKLNKQTHWCSRPIQVQPRNRVHTHLKPSSPRGVHSGKKSDKKPIPLFFFKFFMFVHLKPYHLKTRLRLNIVQFDERKNFNLSAKLKESERPSSPNKLRKTLFFIQHRSSDSSSRSDTM